MCSRTASCSCGQLRIQVEGEPRGVGICHCLAGQRRTGSVFAALASFTTPFRGAPCIPDFWRASVGRAVGRRCNPGSS